MSFQKYFAMFQHQFMRGLEYRTELLLWVLLDTAPNLILFGVWAQVFRDQPVVQGYTLERMIHYYFFMILIATITSSHFEPWRVKEIREGKIDHYFTKPFSYIGNIFSEYLGSKLLYFLFLIPSMTIVAVLTQYSLNISLLPSSGFAVLQFSGLMVYAFLVEFFLAMIIVMIGFWLEYAESLEHFKWLVVSLFSGSMIPVVFMPEWLRAIVTTLPIQYMFSVPIEILYGTRILQWQEIMYAGFFLILLWVISQLIWQKAKLRYSSGGG